MRNVMTTAWEIAKDGAAKFGGKVKEYFGEALKMAWAIVKQTATTVTIQLAEGSRKHKTWVAEVVGLDAKYGFNRQFVNGFEDEEVRGLFFELTEGKVYDVNCARDGREYATVRNGELVELSQNEVKAMFA
ncbi:hypothetical protein [Metasolibacillus sp.]|uniref:hypothetical protein n=1 Tax=Metasolibacillus sp. TaxID=2703680 RepID=UPI0025FB4858|nr:hypothetical protein [Metasolibacillus sp.]MCT6924122.1 hypothetical protein [Metasolibacillus sp.]MCT6940229.1 hypothetical protein [Metasolibacillus sp.]